MPLQCEVLPYRPEAREKFLCAFRVPKAAHATLSFVRRLVAVLRPVVQPGSRFLRTRDLRPPTPEFRPLQPDNCAVDR